jgi:hypothetical protein
MAKAKDDAVQQPLLFDLPAAPQIGNQHDFSLQILSETLSRKVRAAL